MPQSQCNILERFVGFLWLVVRRKVVRIMRAMKAEFLCGEENVIVLSFVV